MKFNLNFLKFHHFNKNKEFNNLTKNNEFVNDKITFDDLYKSLKNVLHIVENEKSILALTKKPKCHFCDKVAEKVIAIIKECHKNLYMDLNQFLEKYDNLEDFKIIQFKLDARSRLICFYNDSNQTIYPLIFDFKHCFYKIDSNDGHHFQNHTKSQAHQWDHKFKQNNIKQMLKN